MPSRPRSKPTPKPPELIRPSTVRLQQQLAEQASRLRAARRQQQDEQQQLERQNAIVRAARLAKDRSTRAVVRFALLGGTFEVELDGDVAGTPNLHINVPVFDSQRQPVVVDSKQQLATYRVGQWFPSSPPRPMNLQPVETYDALAPVATTIVASVSPLLRVERLDSATFDRLQDTGAIGSLLVQIDPSDLIDFTPSSFEQRVAELAAPDLDYHLVQIVGYRAEKVVKNVLFFYVELRVLSSRGIY